MALQGVRDGRSAVAKDVNEGDEAAQGAQLEVWFQRIKDTHEALVKRAALIIDNQPHCYPLNSCSFMEEVTVCWPFTSKVIPDPIVDWNKPPLFDEEIEILQLKEALKLCVSNISQPSEELGVRIDFGSSNILTKESEWDGFLVINDAYKGTPNRAWFVGCNNGDMATLVEGNIVNMPGKEVVPLIFEDSSLAFRFEKINLKYKIDADKFRQIQLYKLEDEFFQAGENDAE